MISRMAGRTPIVIAATCVGFLALAAVIYATLTSSGQYANRDFMSLYAGGRAVAQGLDPYDPEVWKPLRARFGSTWFPDDRAPFPLWTLLLLVPFSVLDLGWAAAVWLASSLFALGAGMVLLLRSFGRRGSVSVFELLVLTALTFTFRATVLGMHNGQITFHVFLFLVLFLVLERSGRPFLAGLALAAVALKPNAFMLFVPTLGLWLLYRRRWALLAGAAVGGLILSTACWIVQPGWLGEWMNVRSKTSATWLTPTLWGIAYDLAGSNWPALGLGLVAAATALLGWLIFSRRDLTLPQVTCLALIGSLLTTPYAWGYEQLFLLIPATLVFLTVENRRQAVLLWVIMTCLVPWGAVWVALRRGFDTLSVLVVFVTGMLYWYCAVRKQASTA